MRRTRVIVLVTAIVGSTFFLTADADRWWAHIRA